MSESILRPFLQNVAGSFAVCVRLLSEPFRSLGLDDSESEVFPAASVIKIGIMSGLLEDVSNGLLSLDDEIAIEPGQVVGGAGVLFELNPGRGFTLAELCRLMMVVSDNTASNACLRTVGMERLNSFFKARGYQACLQRYFMGPVVDGKDNTMTCFSAVSMLADLYNGKGLTPDLRKFAIGCLRRQQYREKIPLLLPPGVPVGHKTGELDGVRHDSAVVELDEPYLVSIFTADGAEPWLVDQAMAKCSYAVYERALMGFESEMKV